MKRWLALVLLVTLLFCLAACGENGGSDPIPAQNSSDSAVKGVTDLKITSLKTGSDTYSSGDAIDVTLEWTGTPAENSWVGIIPADTPHGSEEVNDGEDVIYRYLPEIVSGEAFSFEIYLEPGEYTVRVHDTDAGGIELAFCDFTVK